MVLEKSYYPNDPFKPKFFFLELKENIGCGYSKIFVSCRDVCFEYPHILLGLKSKQDNTEICSVI